MKTLMLVITGVLTLCAADLHRVEQRPQPTKEALIGKDVRSAKITGYDYSKFDHSVLIYMAEGRASRLAMPGIRRISDQFGQSNQVKVAICYSGLVGPAKAHTLLHRGGGIDWYPRVSFVASWGSLPMPPGPVVLIVDRAGIVTDAYLGWSQEAEAAIRRLE